MSMITIIFGTTKRTQTIIAASMAIGTLLIILNFYFQKQISIHIFTTLNLVSAVIILGPSLFLRYGEYARMKDIESRFPDWLRDVTEGIRAGMTLPQAIKSTRRNKYGALTPYTRKMITQIDWGIPFENVLQGFAEKSTKIMKRTVSTIVETHRSGGNIADVLEAVGRSIVEVDKIKRERAAHIYAQMITGYTIFFIFLGVMVGLQKFLIPSLTAITPEAGLQTVAIPELVGAYTIMFQWLIVIQGLFSGLAIGKMAEGSILAGLRHSFVMVALGYTIFTLAQTISI